MIVLSREEDQSIVIGDDCVLTVTSLVKESATLTFVIDGQENKVVKLKRNETVKVKDDKVGIVMIGVRKCPTGPLKAMIGVNAHKDVFVHRKEVFEAIRRTK